MHVSDAFELVGILRQDPVESRQQGFVRELRAFFRRQGRSIIATLALGLTLTQAWDGERWDGELAELLTRRTTTVGLLGAQAVLDRWARAGFTWSDQQLRDRLAENAARAAGAINNTTYNNVAAARMAGRSVNEVFLEAQAVRAPQQAQSQTTFANSQGRQTAADLVGLRSKTWRVTSRHPRDSHAALDGETVGVNETFSNGARWPGDSNLSVDERANCQCVLEYSFEKP
jgi:hypothetical protein